VSLERTGADRSVAVGLRCSDGVILGVERLLHSKLLVKGANKRIQSIDTHVGVATAGLLADGKHLAQRGREEANNFRDQYGAPVPLNASHAFFIHLSALVCLNGPGL